MAPFDVAEHLAVRRDRDCAPADATSDLQVDRTSHVLDAYRQAWNSHDEATARGHLERCWTPHSVYVNPFVEPVTGIDGLTDLILDYHALFPNLSLQPTAITLHHDYISYRWLLTSSAPIRIKGTDFDHRMTGQDLITIDGTGRLARGVAFLDGLTAAAPDRVAPARLRGSVPRL